MAQQTTLASLRMHIGGVGSVGDFNLGLGSPGLGTMPGGLNMLQLAQLDATGMNLFNTNMLGMANLSAIGILPEAQLLVAQIAAAGGGFGHSGLGFGAAGLGGFAGCRRVCRAGERGGPGRSGGRSLRRVDHRIT